MSIPDYQTLMAPVLHTVPDCHEHQVRDLSAELRVSKTRLLLEVARVEADEPAEQPELPPRRASDNLLIVGDARATYLAARTASV